jgi:hypothetical protein
MLFGRYLFNLIILIVGYAFSLGGGYALATVVTGFAARRRLPEGERYRGQPAFLGVLDRVIYTTAVLTGFALAVLAWLAVKVALAIGRRDEVPEPAYLFQMREAVSLIVAVGVGLLMRFLLR